jgi:GGDEF domain-containing protein
LKERIRGTDVLARLGGDEFGIILPRADENQAQIVAEDIVKALRRQTAMLGEAVIPITASVGVACSRVTPRLRSWRVPISRCTKPRRQDETALRCTSLRRALRLGHRRG